MMTIVLLVASNVFMTFAWYGHLKQPKWTMVTAILISWGIAFFEYCLQVPANRIGDQQGWSGFQLKITQEVITLCVFIVFAKYYLGEHLRWNHGVAFALITAAVFFARMPTPEPAEEKTSAPAEALELTKKV